jgi:glycosyltransferase involved in cell wall biosynthesis
MQPRELGQRLLLFRSAGRGQTRRALAHLRHRYPGSEISVLAPESESEGFREHAAVAWIHAYSTRGALWREGCRLLRELRAQRFDHIVLPAHGSSPAAYWHLFIILAWALRARNRSVLGSDLELRPLPRGSVVRAVVDLGLFLLGVPLARAGTRLTLVLARWLPEPQSGARSGTGGIAILLPILPDLSHTFVYREVLELLAQTDGARRTEIVALEEGSHVPLHEEARALLARATFVPSPSLSRYLGWYLAYLVRRPARMAALLKLYQAESDGDPYLFLRLTSFHGLHPSRGLAVARLLEGKGVSHIHSYGADYPTTRALVASRLLGVPFSMSTFVDFEQQSAFKCLAQKVREARFVVCCTRYCRTRLLAMTTADNASKVHVIHHGLPAHYAPARPSAASSDSGVVGVFAACRLVGKKGLDDLIRACALLKAQGDAVRCLIIGEGEEEAHLRTLVSRLGLLADIRFHDAVSNDQIWKIVGPEDLCIVPSVYRDDGERDGVPVILMEALLHGHAVVSTCVSGIPELITDGTHGILVPERDPGTLAAAIRRLLNDPALRRRLASNGAARVRTDFNVAEKADQLRCLLQAVGAAKAAPA